MDFDRTLQIVFLGLLTLTAVRIYSLVRGSVWIAMNGRAHEERRLELYGERRLTREEEASLYDAHGGRFLPFGPRSYRLRRWACGGKGLAAWLFRRPFHLVRFFWRFYIFPVICGVVLLFASRFPTDATSSFRWLGLTVGILCMVGMLIIAIEAVLSYIITQSWASSYHRFPNSEGRANPVISEFNVFFGSAILTYLVTVAVLTYCALRFGGLPDLEGGVPRFWDTLARASYFAMEYLTGISSAQPQTNAARVVAALMVLLFGGFLLVAFAILLGIAFLSPRSGSVSPELASQPKEAPEEPSNNTARMRRYAAAGGALLLVVVALREVLSRIAQ